MVTTRSRRFAITTLGALAGVAVLGLVTWLLLGERDDASAQRGAVLTRAGAGAESGAPGLPAVDAAHPADVQGLASAATGNAADAAAQAAADLAAAAPGSDVLFTGRVVDERGAPVAGALVSHLPSYRLRKALGLFKDPDTYELAWDRLAHTTTAADGSFSLRSRDDLAAAEAAPSTHGSFLNYDATQPVLLVQHPDFVVRAHVCRDFVTTPHDAGTIALAAGASLTGRVVSEEGEPLAGARVAPAKLGRRMEDLRAGNWSLARQAIVGTSGADGRFRVDGLPSGELDIDIEHQDSVPVQLQPRLQAGDVTDLGDVKLARGKSIRGVVLGSDGLPIEGAKVLARASGMGIGSRGDDSVLMELTLTVYAPGIHEVRVKTVADGSFTVGTLNQSHYSVFADAPGREPVCTRDVAVGNSDLVLTLHPQATLLLTVVDAQSQAPIAGAHGEATRNSGNDKATEEGFDPELEVLEGAKAAAAVAAAPGGVASGAGDGAGLLLVLRAGPVRTDVTVSAPGYATRAFVLPGVQPGERLVRTLQLQREAVLAGRVLDAKQQPIGRAEVTLSPPKDVQTGLGDRETTTDEHGVFRFGELQAGAWSLAVKAAGFVDSEPQPVTVAAEQAREDVDVVLARAATVRGIVLGVDGAPVVSQPVNARQDDPAQRGRTWSLRADKDGRFVFDSLPAGPVVVTAWPGGEAHVVLVAGTETAVTLTLRRLPVVYGRVTAAGAPVANAQVTVFSRVNFFDDLTKQSSALGAYEIELPSPGRFVLAAHGAVGEDGVSTVRSRPVPVTADWDQRQLVDLVFGGGRLSGIVVDSASGQPIEGAGLQLHNRAVDADAAFKGLETNLDSIVRTGADGRYTFERLQAGDYDILASARGYAPERAESVSVVEGAPVEAPRIALSRGAVIKGTVRTASGKPLPPQLRVHLDPVNGPSHNLVADVKADGTWIWDLVLEPGAWQVRLVQQEFVFFDDSSKPAAALATAQVSLKAGETQVVDLVISD